MSAIKHPQFYRQKFLLALLTTFGGKIYHTDFIKHLFIYENEYNKTIHNYFFLPYKYGPFSFQAYTDLRRLENLDLIVNQDNITLKSDFNYLSLLKPEDKTAIKRMFNDYREVKGQQLITAVYKKYPYYSQKSLIKDDILGSTNEINDTPLAQKFFSIGYEGITIDQYLNSLIENNIKALIDVRKNPASMKYGFNKAFFIKNLKELDIEYLHIPELGIESEERQNLNSFADYQKLFQEYEATVLVTKKKAIRSIVEHYQQHGRIALTCFEKDHLFCHRSRIANYIEEHFNIKVTHL